MADPDAVPASELEKENRVLRRRLHRMEANVRQLEELQDSNATLLSRVGQELEEERAKSQRLLLNVLPRRIADRLAAGESPIADRHDDVTVLLSDFVGFTSISAELAPAVLIEELNALFSGFDAICDAAGVEKIKTVGDAYLVVGGILGGDDGAAAVAETALEMAAFVAGRARTRPRWQVRIGVDSGPIVAGVVGVSKFAYDVWGDTVNVASRLETTSEPGRIHVSSLVARRLGRDYQFEPRGAVDLKGKGLAETFFLVGRR